MAQIVEMILRKTGSVANVVLACVFVWIAFKLGLLARTEYALAGGIPSPDLEGIRAFVSDPEAVARARHLALAWIAAVFAAGAFYMGALGARWCYHAMVRAAMTFRA